MFRHLFACLLLLLAFASPVLAGGEIGFMTGDRNGTYYRVARDLQGAVGKHGISLMLRESKGSVDNLQKLAKTGENAALGIVQSDVISFLMRSPMPQSKEISRKLRIIAPLFPEEIHLLARKEIGSIEDLKDKRVVVGSSGSGNMMTAVNLLSQLGIKPKRLFEVSSAEAIVAVMANRADAMVFVGGKPVPMFKNMEKLISAGDVDMENLIEQVHFLPIPADKAQGIYEPATLSINDYSFIERDVPTLAVRAVLVGYDFTLKNTPYYHTRCKQLANFGRALAKSLPDLQATGHPKWMEVDMQQDLKLWRRDSCAWPGFNGGPGVAATKASFNRDPAPAIPRNSTLEQELLGIITGGK
jgi:uncharacterized protein